MNMDIDELASVRAAYDDMMITPKGDIVTGFTIKLDGDPRAMSRLLAALRREMQDISNEAFADRHQEIFVMQSACDSGRMPPIVRRRQHDYTGVLELRPNVGGGIVTMEDLAQIEEEAKADRMILQVKHEATFRLIATKLAWALFNHTKGNHEGGNRVTLRGMEIIDEAVGTDFAADWREAV